MLQDLKPVRGYEGARYPTLAEHLSRSARSRKVKALALTAAFAALAVLMSGCRGIG